MDEQAAMTVPSFLAEEAEFSFGSMRQMPSEDRDTKQGDFSFDKDMILRPFPEHNKSSPRGGLASRIAARAGFNAPCLNTKSIRPKDDPSLTNEAKSPYLIIPSGISPTALLDSPVFISNSLNQASPTTGKFQLFTDGNSKRFLVDNNGVSKDGNFEKIIDSSSFAFKPLGEPAVPFSLSAAYKASQNMNSQALSDAKVSVRTDNTSGNFKPSEVQSHESFSDSVTDKESWDKIGRSEIKSLDSTSHTAEHSPPISDQQDDRGDHDGVDSITGSSTGFVAEDGYHWRKYGQKQVKGSEYPRSYYRCTYMNCPVRKKVEMSPKGHITGVICKGSHNHPVPASNHVSTKGSSQFDNSHGQVENVNSNRGPVWGAPHNGVLPGTHVWRNGSFEQNSVLFMNTEIHHPLPSVQMQNGILKSGDAVAGSSTYSNDDGQTDCGTHGSISNEEGDESESKRRRTETFAAELGSGATRAIREPRVVVQTRSDVDILDDGYRWRKYGQKVVKGNPNPRSYYKCTYVGCMVRKHVERASNDYRSVLTTYEGKHNHDVPAARNSSHANSPISAASASLPQNIILPQPPRLGSFNRPVMQSHAPLPTQHMQSFQMGMNQQSSQPGFKAGHSEFLGMAQTHPMQQQQVNGMGFMMPRGDPNSASNLY